MLVCYDGFDVDLPYDDQDKSLYDIMELMNSDFYDGVTDYYAENPDPRLQIMKRGDMPSWKLPKDKNYALKGGVYVGGEYESASDKSDSEEEFDDEE